jgi:hypothetical protein
LLALFSSPELFGSTVATGACRAYTAAAMGLAGIIAAIGSGGHCGTAC